MLLAHGVNIVCDTVCFHRFAPSPPPCLPLLLSFGHDMRNTPPVLNFAIHPFSLLPLPSTPCSSYPSYSDALRRQSKTTMSSGLFGWIWGSSGEVPSEGDALDREDDDMDHVLGFAGAVTESVSSGDAHNTDHKADDGRDQPSTGHTQTPLQCIGRCELGSFVMDTKFLGR